MHLTQTNGAVVQPYTKELIQILENDLSQPKKYKIEGERFNTFSQYLQALKATQ